MQISLTEVQRLPKNLHVKHFQEQKIMRESLKKVGKLKIWGTQLILKPFWFTSHVFQGWLSQKIQESGKTNKQKIQ